MKGVSIVVGVFLVLGCAGMAFAGQFVPGNIEEDQAVRESHALSLPSARVVIPVDGTEYLVEQLKAAKEQLSIGPSKAKRRTHLDTLTGKKLYGDYTLLSTFLEMMRLSGSLIYEDGEVGLMFTDDDGNQGMCLDGYSFDADVEFGCMLLYSSGYIHSDYFFFDVDGSDVDGRVSWLTTSGSYSSAYAFTGAVRGMQSTTGDSVVEEDGFYYVPFIPKKVDFSTGFALSNFGNNEKVTVTIKYYTNGGVMFATQTEVLSANGQTSFVPNVAFTEDGWAHIAASKPIHGMALVFGYGDDPMFDMSIQTDGSKELVISHAANTDGWTSYAMLANPNNAEATVSLTMYPSDGGATAMKQIVIPAMGAVQQPLDSLGDTGSVYVTSTQNLVGFQMFDGREIGRNWVGGLNITPR